MKNLRTISWHRESSLTKQNELRERFLRRNNVVPWAHIWLRQTLPVTLREVYGRPLPSCQIFETVALRFWTMVFPVSLTVSGSYSRVWRGCNSCWLRSPCSSAHSCHLLPWCVRSHSQTHKHAEAPHQRGLMVFKELFIIVFSPGMRMISTEEVTLQYGPCMQQGKSLDVLQAC